MKGITHVADNAIDSKEGKQAVADGINSSQILERIISRALNKRAEQGDHPAVQALPQGFPNVRPRAQAPEQER
jgi:hypothetical protein